MQVLPGSELRPSGSDAKNPVSFRAVLGAVREELELSHEMLPDGIAKGVLGPYPPTGASHF